MKKLPVTIIIVETVPTNGSSVADPSLMPTNNIINNSLYGPTHAGPPGFPTPSVLV